MVNIRNATVDDLFEMQNDNLFCLPENYQVSTHTGRTVAIRILRPHALFSLASTHAHTLTLRHGRSSNSRADSDSSA